MENRLKHKLSRIFRSSAASCRSKHTSDTAEQPFFFPQNPHHHHQLIELFSPRPPPPKCKPFPSICKPKTSNPPDILNHLTTRTTLSPFPAEKKSTEPPPPLPHKTEQKKQRKSRKARRKKCDTKKFDQLFSSMSGNYSGWYSSSEDENEKKDYDDATTFFSSKSMSSDSSEYFGKNRGKKDQSEKKKKCEGQKGNFPMSSTRVVALDLEGKVKDSFAVVKSSSDPYNDFRTSMVEMIVERQIFGTEDLDKLLQCFLSLNNVVHHKVIVQVYLEIWETLFSDCI